MKYTFLLLTIISISNMAATAQPSNEPEKKIKQLHWLEGTWQMDTPKGTFTEKWEVKDPSTLIGFGYMTSNGDTVFSEQLSIVLSDNEVYYHATPSDQNDGKTIPFKLVNTDQQTYTFQNKAHDFPTEIIYQRKSNNELVATVQGEVNGELKQQVFNMQRVK